MASPARACNRCRRCYGVRAEEMKSSFFVLAGWLIDGSAGSVRRDVIMEVVNGSIVSLKRMRRGELPQGHVPVLDLSRSTVLPGLVDGHVHLTMSGTTDEKARRFQLSFNFEQAAPVIEEHLRSHLGRGVVAVRDGGDSSGHTLRYRDERLRWSGLPIRLKAAGHAWRSRGRYGRMIGSPPGEGTTLGQAIARRKGVIDHAKIINAGLNSLREFGKETAPQFAAGEMEEAVLAGRRCGIGIMVHANGKLPVEQSIWAGCCSIEHGFFMGKDNIERMAEMQVYWVPTAFSMQAYSRLLEAGSLEAGVAERNLEHQLGQIAYARELGVPVVLGTDSGGLGLDHGEAFIAELRLLMEAGYNAEEGPGSSGSKESWDSSSPACPPPLSLFPEAPSRFPSRCSLLKWFTSGEIVSIEYISTRRCPMDHKRRKLLERIFFAGLEAVDPEAAVHRSVHRSGSLLRVGGSDFDLDRFRRVLLVGAGKGTAPMAKAVEEILGDRLTGGWIIVKYGHGAPLEKVRTFYAAHPVPDQSGLEAAEAILDHLEGCTAEDLVLCAFSGGGSALFPAPHPRISFHDKRETTRLLLRCGATIGQINALRKHLSRVKGGGLARTAHPATLVSLFLSDVIGDRLDVIASGPTVPDSSTFRDCIQIIEHYGLGGAVPRGVLELLREGVAGLLPETPKKGEPVFERVRNVIVGSNRAALEAAAREAASLGFTPLILSAGIEGEAREVGRVLAAVAREVKVSGHPVAPPACILAGGETTVTLRGDGKGGRSQELALAAAIALEGWEGISMLSAGTDGTDGPTDAAGAFADGEVCARAREMGLDPWDYLAGNDSYVLHDRLGNLLRTGPTRTNVMDIVCILID